MSYDPLTGDSDSTLDGTLLSWLAQPPEQRSPNAIDEIALVTEELGAEVQYSFLSQLPASQHLVLAREWTQMTLDTGATLCSTHDACASFFLVVHGAIVVEEPRLSHFDAAEARRHSLAAGAGAARGQEVASEGVRSNELASGA